MVSLLETFGFENLFNFGGFISKVLYFILILFGAAIIIGAMYFYSKYRKKKNPNVKQIGWWEEVHNDMIPLTMDSAEEITMPGTNLKVFFVKAKKLWLPRFTRGITKDLFYVCITPDREIVNFSLKCLSKDRAEAELNYDHTDMRWAAENEREFIKRNYRDKTTTWWKEYKDIIAVAIIIVLITASFCVILWMMSGIVRDIGSIAGSVAESVDRCAIKGSSGIVGV